MGKKASSKGKECVKAVAVDGPCRIKHGDASEREREVNAAIDASVERFVRANQANIKKSSKEKIARASYGGGMADMLMLIRSALGRWAIDELLVELENWTRAPPPPEGQEIRVNVQGIGPSGVTAEDTKELEQQIAKWIEQRKGNGKRQTKDVMFA